MLSALDHHRPLANGYSGFFPAHYQHLKFVLSEFPTAPGVQQLRLRGIDYAVLSKAEWQRIQQHAAVQESFALVHEDLVANVVICRIQPAQ